ncbi:Uu.00g047760.m01.CDS01 [Anthostomella pinea]|uniref:Sister chromatid cohesion protein n=1 Tax=Anthostomella pinea TaxID=933095 RepID=A0AAI8V6K1_9PEZI|nr:Uu.00g047760.m01.CDS01 [Anthostomella pinea]
MAHPQPHDRNGLAPQYGQQLHPQSQSQPGAPNRNSTQPFTLHEALPYTPFTSVFPFEFGILNNPTIGSGPLAPSIADLVSREDYDALNQEAENPNQSKRLDGSLEYVQNLLKAEKITQFQFKTAPKVTLPADASRKSLTDGIPPFAKLVYDNTSISSRYPTPDTSKASTPNGPPMSPRTSKKSPKARRQEPPKIVKHNPASANAQAVASNKARIEIHLPTQKERNAAASLYASPKPASPMAPSPATLPQPQTISPADLMVRPQVTPVPLPKIPMPSVPKPQPKPLQPAQAVPLPHVPHAIQKAKAPSPSPAPSEPTPRPRPSSTPSSQRPAVISIEIPTPSFNKNEFAVVPDSPYAPVHLSVKKNHKLHGDIDDPLSTDLNQRDRAKAIFADLRRCFQDIFGAEEQLGSHPGVPSSLMIMTNEQEPAMTSLAQDRAQKQIHRAIENGCYHQAPLEDLIRIQNLSESSLKHAETLDVKIDESWGETDVGFWVQQLPDIDTGLKAARTSLRIMCGGREEKQLYSEDLIQLGLSLFKNVMDGIIVPVAELRSTGPTGNLFRVLANHKKTLGTLFTSCQRLFALMSDLMTSIDLSESVVNTLESLASRLIFVENAHTEKDSVIGAQKFDGLRLVAMNILSQIFLMNPAQREGILSEILTSLEKLPVGKQSARGFKLSDGGSIQPVSALIMRLVQASAGKHDDGKDKNRGQLLRYIEDGANDSKATNGSISGNTKPHYTIKTEDHAAAEDSIAVQELQDLTKQLSNGAYHHAHYVIRFMVKRALKSTKTGEESRYRNLLDMFVEDFTNCLDSTDWPAAELFLRLTMYLMFQQVDGEKNSAPARNMALELLGVMAAAISRLRSHVRKTASNIEGTDSDELGRWLADLSLNVLDGNVSVEKTLKWEGPYRIVLEYLQGRLSDDEHLRSAISYLITDWGSQMSSGYESLINAEESDDRNPEFGRTAFRLRNMIEDPKWLSREWSFKSVVASHAKLSHSIILLRSSFCTAFRNILNVLLGSMTTDQATVRSRSIKSINQVLETDPTILDGDSVVIELILQCSSDSSPQVRDSALGLIGKCINMRPRLEERMTSTVIQRFVDSGVGVRKRAMKLAKDIYLGNDNKTLRSTIANGLLHRMQDPEESVRELARQMIEEIWISPFYKEDDSVAFKQSLTDHVALMVQTAKQGNTALVLDNVFQTILSPDSKLADANTRVCTRLVANMFDLVDNPESDDPSVPSGKDALQVLMIFAKADPKLFTFEQIRLLEPHIASVSTSEDLAVSRAVVVIYRRVLPRVPSVHSQFLSDIRKALMLATPKITRSLLDDAVACIWIISDLLQTSEPIARLVVSSLAGIQKIRGILAKGLDQKQTGQFGRYSLLVGMVGKHCNLDSHEDLFKAKFPKWKGNPVSKLMVDVIIPFADSSQPADVRRPALDAIGLICQANPKNYVAPNVWKTFEMVFEQKVPALESMILRSFKEFLFKEEQRSEQAASSAPAGKEKKDLKVMGGTTFDDVSSATTQRFLKNITRIALATHDDHAFLAMEVLASINRQGLVHPKETGVTLITLETCPVSRISELAYQEHRALHEKYESVLEREYAKAIQTAFQYQQDIIDDPRGATTDPFTSKFHLLAEVLKISKSKSRLKFLDKFVGQIDFEPSKLDVSQPMPSHVAYSRFLVENLAFFEYVTIGELQTTVSAMEKLVTRTGSAIAQAVESEIFQVRMDSGLSSQPPIDGDAPPTAINTADSVDPLRLRQLAAGSMIMLAVWEARTHLRRSYGLNPNRREGKGKGAAKDLTKAPVRVQGVTGDKFWEDVSSIMSGLDTSADMIEKCRAFVDLLNVDNEVKIGDDDEDIDADGEPRTPDAEGEDEDPPDARGRKRKAAATPGGRKKRARSNSKPRPRGRPRKQSTEKADVDMEEAEPWV